MLRLLLAVVIGVGGAGLVLLGYWPIGLVALVLGIFLFSGVGEGRPLGGLFARGGRKDDTGDGSGD